MLNLIQKNQKIVIKKAKESFVFTWHVTIQIPKDFDGWGTYFEPGDAFKLGLRRSGFHGGRNRPFQKKKKKTYRGQKHTKCYCHTSTVLFVSFNFSIKNGLLFHSGLLRVEEAEYTVTRRFMDLTKTTLFHVKTFKGPLEDLLVFSIFKGRSTLHHKLHVSNSRSLRGTFRLF